MKAGRFKAVVLDKAITENQKKNPQVVIQLEVDFETEKQTMNYFGQLVGGATEHTLKALVACGIQGNSPFDPITKGTEVSVVIDEEKDTEGKTKFRISWVNKPMGMGEPMDERKGRAALSKLEGALARLRVNDPKPIKKQDDVPPWESEDIPF